MLGNITFGPFVEELEASDDKDEVCDSSTSSLVSNEVRYWSSENIPFSMESSILEK